MYLRAERLESSHAPLAAGHNFRHLSPQAATSAGHPKGTGASVYTQVKPTPPSSQAVNLGNEPIV